MIGSVGNTLANRLSERIPEETQDEWEIGINQRTDVIGRLLDRGGGCALKTLYPFLAAQAGWLFKASNSIWMLNNHPVRAIFGGCAPFFSSPGLPLLSRRGEGMGTQVNGRQSRAGFSPE
jgi:hypothetical protein